MVEWEKPKPVRFLELVVIRSIYGFTEEKKQEIIERLLDTNEVMGQKFLMREDFKEFARKHGSQTSIGNGRSMALRNQ